MSKKQRKHEHFQALKMTIATYGKKENNQR